MSIINTSNSSVEEELNYLEQVISELSSSIEENTVEVKSYTDMIHHYETSHPNPNDNTLRLVYADALEDAGKSDKAELHRNIANDNIHGNVHGLIQTTHHISSEASEHSNLAYPVSSAIPYEYPEEAIHPYNLSYHAQIRSNTLGTLPKDEFVHNPEQIRDRLHSLNALHLRAMLAHSSASTERPEQATHHLNAAEKHREAHEIGTLALRHLDNPETKSIKTPQGEMANSDWPIAHDAFEDAGLNSYEEVAKQAHEASEKAVDKTSQHYYLAGIPTLDRYVQKIRDSKNTGDHLVPRENHRYCITFHDLTPKQEGDNEAMSLHKEAFELHEAAHALQQHRAERGLKSLLIDQVETPTHHTIVDNWVKNSLPTKLGNQYGNHLKTVIDKVTPTAQQQILDNLGDRVTFHSSPTTLTRHFNRTAPTIADELKPGQRTAGYIENTDDGPHLHLTGGSDIHPEYNKYNTQNVFAHELGEVLNVGDKYSSHPDWNNAWKEEIAYNPESISKYAAKDPHEGFAEFFRYSLSNPETKETHPKSYKFLADRGLLDDKDDGERNLKGREVKGGINKTPSKDVGPWSFTPDELENHTRFFKTSQGSLYALHNKTGRTIRLKSPHDLHDRSDVGIKSSSEKTLYIHPDHANKIGLWQTSSANGKRILLDTKNKHLLLTSLHPKTGIRGKDSETIPYGHAPLKGLSPLELSDKSSQHFGENIEGWKGNHPGSPITELDTPHEEGHKLFVEAAKKAGKTGIKEVKSIIDNLSIENTILEKKEEKSFDNESIIAREIKSKKGDKGYIKVGMSQSYDDLPFDQKGESLPKKVKPSYVKEEPRRKLVAQAQERLREKARAATPDEHSDRIVGLINKKGKVNRTDIASYLNLKKEHIDNAISHGLKNNKFRIEVEEGGKGTGKGRVATWLYPVEKKDNNSGISDTENTIETKGFKVQHSSEKANKLSQNALSESSKTKFFGDKQRGDFLSKIRDKASEASRLRDKGKFADSSNLHEDIASHHNLIGNVHKAAGEHEAAEANHKARDAHYLAQLHTGKEYLTKPFSGVIQYTKREEASSDPDNNNENKSLDDYEVKGIKSGSKYRLDIKDKNAKLMWDHLFPGVKPQHAGKLIGAPEGSYVSLAHDKENGIHKLIVVAEHPHLEDLSFVFHQNPETGNVHSELGSMYVHPDKKGNGIGSQIFHNAVKEQAKLGIKDMETYAVKGPSENGYYTWPRLGFDAPLHEVYDRDIPRHISKLDQIEDVVPGAKTVRDVISHPEGRKWWKENGKEIKDAKFDLTEGSDSRNILDNYMSVRGNNS